jgi:hypothetical protein
MIHNDTLIVSGTCRKCLLHQKQGSVNCVPLQYGDMFTPQHPKHDFRPNPGKHNLSLWFCLIWKKTCWFAFTKIYWHVEDLKNIFICIQKNVHLFIFVFFKISPRYCNISSYFCLQCFGGFILPCFILHRWQEHAWKRRQRRQCYEFLWGLERRLENSPPVTGCVTAKTGEL